MICSGEQTIFLYPVTQQDQPAVTALLQSLEQYRNGTLVLSASGIAFSDTIPSTDFSFTRSSETDWEYREKTGYKHQLFIIGGGHCALAFSKLMRSLDFYITLFEERKDLPTVERNEYAQEKILVDDYTALDKLIPAGKQQYVVIMTFGYRTDDIALRSLLHKPFAYLGVLGSAKKMEELFTSYRKEGIDEHLLQRIRTPIGLTINSRTPDEIAVSIAAEIIQLKNNA